MTTVLTLGPVFARSTALDPEGLAAVDIDRLTVSCLCRFPGARGRALPVALRRSSLPGR